MRTPDFQVAESTPPGVSVVIPAYNYAHFLRPTIESALNQTWKNLEVIVVDDGSTDNTREVVNAYLDAGVRYIWKENGGLPAARNTGIRAAKFDYVAFLDADDVWFPQMVERCLTTLLGLPRTFGLVACRHTAIDTQGNSFYKRRIDWRSHSREITSRAMLIRSRFNPSAVLARKSAIEEAGYFDETLTSSEDRDMWIRLSTHRKVYLLSEDLLSVRFHPNSMSKNARRMKVNVRRVLKKAWNDGVVPKWNLPFWAKAFSFHLYETAWMYHDSKQSLQALAYVFGSILTYPFFLFPWKDHVPFLYRLRSARRFLMGAMFASFHLSPPAKIARQS